MAATLPRVPHFIFTIFEPLTLVAGALAPVIDPAVFVASQLPLTHPYHWTKPAVAISQIASFFTPSGSKSTLASLHPTALEHILALQLGNTYMLILLLGVFILHTTSEARVVRAFIWACWIADIGHLVGSGYVMGSSALADVGAWTPVVWGNIGITLFLFISRSAYLAGLCGPDRDIGKSNKVKST